MRLDRMLVELATSSRTYRSAFLICATLFVLILALSFSKLPALNWNNLPLHASVEMVGAAFALLTGYFLLNFEIQDSITPHRRQIIASTLTAVAILDGVHATLAPGPLFVLLHTAATFAGGLIGCSVFLPGKITRSIVTPRYVVAFCVVFITIALLRAEWMPAMLQEGQFTRSFKLLNTVGGALLVAAGLKLILAFGKSNSATGLMFGFQFSLLGASALFLSGSALWHYSWWEAHFVRLIAHGLPLLLLVEMAHQNRRSALVRLQETEAENQLLVDRAEDEIGKRTALLKENYQSLVVELPIGLLVLELIKADDVQSLVLVDLNPAAESQLQLIAATVRGQRLVEVFPGLLSSDLPHRYAQVIRSHTPTDIGQIIYGDERLAEAVYSVKAFPLGGHKAGVAFEDITDRFRSQRVKEEFVSVVSHELRTPLTSIRGAVDLVRSGVLGDLPAKALPVMEIASHNCERLAILINDLLDMEKIQSGKMEFQLSPLAIAGIIERAMEESQTFASSHNISLVFENGVADAHADVDANRLVQVIANLISNAIKFSRSGDEVLLRLGRDNGELLLEVIDHGEGIPENFKSVIFEKFSQAEAPGTRKKGGAGLGLSIAKAMIEKMAGSVGFHSTEHVGSVFFIRLPEYRPSDVKLTIQ